jgi:hypothetical protein
VASFSEWISSSQKLKTLKVENVRDATLVGWQSFAAALASLDNLEDINVKFFEEDSRVGMILLNSFMAKPTLKRVEFPLPTVDQLQMIENVLVSPNCIITDLTLACRSLQTIGQAEGEQLIQTLINSLQNNTSLRSMTLKFGERTPFPVHWNPVSNLLCDTSITRWSLYHWNFITSYTCLLIFSAFFI